MKADAVATLEGMLARLSEDCAWNRYTYAFGSVPQVRSAADTKVFVDGQVAAFQAVVDSLGMRIE